MPQTHAETPTTIPDADAAPSAALTLDEAVELMAPEAEPPQDGPAAPEPEPEPDPEPEVEAEAESELGPDPEPAEAPPFWRAEDKAWFAEQPPEVRARLMAYEKSRDTAVARALRDAAEARKAARAEAEVLAGKGGEIAALSERARAALGGWEQVDWVAWAEADPQGALRGKLKYEAEREQLERLDAARQAAEARAFDAYVAEQAEALEALEPELAADASKRQDVGRYLIGQGYQPERLRGVSALDLSLARKAMLWDRANAQLKAAAAPAPRSPQPPPRAVRPAAAATTPTHRRQAEEASHRFAQTRSKEDAIRLLNLRGQ